MRASIPAIPLRYRIIAPFILLVLFIGMVGTTLVTRRVSDTATAEFDASLLRASLLANDHLAVLEADRLAQLRAATNTIGVSDAIATRDLAGLRRLLGPLQANAQPARVTFRVLDRSGRLLATIGPGADPGDPLAYAGDPSVTKVLADRGDSQGDRFVFLAAHDPAPSLYWVGPVEDARLQPVGAILVGQPIADIAQAISESRAGDLFFFDTSGRPLSSSLPQSPTLSPEVRSLVSSDHPVRVNETLGEHGYGLLFADWTMRGQRLGYVGVALVRDGFEQSLNQLRALLIVVFVIGAILTLLLGTLLARRITRPIDQLVAATRVVSGGDLTHRAPVASRDEIGYLARSFNEMTASLQSKTAELEETTFASMEALARAIDARDPSTFGHSSRVAAISMEIAAGMPFPAGDVESLRRAALLHDIGKIGIEDRVLRKPGNLTERDIVAMHAHPLIGYDMLKGLHFLRPSLAGVRNHHERWDGSGYPDALSGEGIPLYVRILSVADVFDAVTSHRPYRGALSFTDARQLIVSGRGTQFDPLVVAAFLARMEPIVDLCRRLGKTDGIAEELDLRDLEETG